MAGNKHLLFLIHGMGTSSGDWSAGMQTAIRDAFKTLPTLANFDFDSLFEFVPIDYGHHFDDLRKGWSDQAKSLLAFLGPLAKEGELDATSKTIVRLAKAADGFTKDDYENTHLLDVFLYRFASQSRHTVRTDVVSQILGRLGKMDSTSPMRWSVIAHSLGTSVAHDSLHEMFTAAPQRARLSLGQLTFPNALVMLANVSALLESDIDVYTSVVAPGAPAAPRFAVRRYVNAFHHFDPIPAVKPFTPVSTWPAPAVRNDNLFVSYCITDIEDLNVHASEHHIRNPRVHGPMFNAFFDASLISSDEIETAYDRYRSTLPINKMNELIDELKQFKPEATDSALTVIKGWRDFLKTVRA
jgi:hypothetical protein